jgi:3'(2'), 5'-bisphosphate nucleotidase
MNVETNTSSEYISLIYEAITATVKAGEAILRIYNASGSLEASSEVTSEHKAYSSPSEVTSEHESQPLSSPPLSSEATSWKQSSMDYELKEDQSPLTKADQSAHTVIEEILKAAFPETPILSEEGKDIPYENRKEWKRFWLVDPLDGTKEFLKRNGEFTVNIALVENNEPVLGVIYAPDKDILYWGIVGEGAYKAESAHAAWVNTINRANSSTRDDEKNTLESLKKESEELPLVRDELPLRDGGGDELPTNTQNSEELRKTIRVVASRSHYSGETEEYVNELAKGATDEDSRGAGGEPSSGEFSSNQAPQSTHRKTPMHAQKLGPRQSEQPRREDPRIELVQAGSSLKLCLIAEGKADVYPRFAPTMEWDTGAGQAIVAATGGRVLQADEEQTLRYNKEDLTNPWFIAKRAGFG